MRSAPARCRVHKDGKPGNWAQPLPPPCGTDMLHLRSATNQIKIRSNVWKWLTGDVSAAFYPLRLVCERSTVPLGPLLAAYEGKWMWMTVPPSRSAGNENDAPQRGEGGKILIQSPMAKSTICIWKHIYALETFMKNNNNNNNNNNKKEKHVGPLCNWKTLFFFESEIKGRDKFCGQSINIMLYH